MTHAAYLSVFTFSWHRWFLFLTTDTHNNTRIIWLAVTIVCGRFRFVYTGYDGQVFLADGKMAESTWHGGNPCVLHVLSLTYTLVFRVPGNRKCWLNRGSPTSITQYCSVRVASGRTWRGSVFLLGRVCGLSSCPSNIQEISVYIGGHIDNVSDTRLYDSVSKSVMIFDKKHF